MISIDEEKTKGKLTIKQNVFVVSLSYKEVTWVSYCGNQEVIFVSLFGVVSHMLA